MEQPFGVTRRASRPVWVGDVQVGGDTPIRVQSMTNTDTADVASTIRQIHELADIGCEIVRIAVPDKAAVAAVPEIVRQTPVPLIADIHFDYKLALAAIEGGIHGLRLNPGNIREAEKVRTVVAAAKERGISIRIGVNAGSLPPLRALADGELPPATWERMVDAAHWEIGHPGSHGLRQHQDIAQGLRCADDGPGPIVPSPPRSLTRSTSA